jgi:hypothetical protein
MIKIKISDACEPYMYNTKSDTKKLNIGDVLDVKFKTGSRVKKEYAGKTVKFFVNNVLDYSFYSPYRRVALIPFSKKDKFSYIDALIVDEHNRFECLMIDLYPANRVPYAGWKNKEVTIKKLQEKVEVKTNNEITLRTDIEFNKNSSFIHPTNCTEHSILSCYGGIGRKSYEEFEEALSLNHIEMVGYETPVPEPGTREFEYDQHFFRVTFKDVVKKEKYFMPGYLFKETIKECNVRLDQYAAHAIEIIKKSKSGRYDHDPYNPYSIGVSYITKSSDEKVDKMLDKYTKEEEEGILDKGVEFLEWSKEFFSRR